jgi:hypothetical protein
MRRGIPAELTALIQQATDQLTVPNSLWICTSHFGDIQVFGQHLVVNAVFLSAAILMKRVRELGPVG